jgi:hypothetical protein
VRTLAVPDEGAGRYVVEAVVLENGAAAVVPKLYVHGCALATNASIIKAHVQSVLKGFMLLIWSNKEEQSWKEEGRPLLGECFHFLNSHEHLAH